MSNLQKMSQQALVKLAIDTLSMSEESVAGFSKEELIQLLDGSQKQEAAKEESTNNRVRIQIYEQEGSEGRDPVAVSVNGVTTVIPRGQIVEIPEHILEALENAVISVREPDGRDEEGNLKYRDRDIRRFNFSRM